MGLAAGYASTMYCKTAHSLHVFRECNEKCVQTENGALQGYYAANSGSPIFKGKKLPLLDRTECSSRLLRGEA